MLDWLYEHFNFWGSLFFLWSAFFMIIFWLAGMAGIMILPPKRTKTIKLIIGVLFPPFTVGWMIYDMFQQKRALKNN
jgi:hypothetical protein